MNDNGFLYNLERAQAGPVDEEALARKMAARTARVARAHESVFTEANGWSGNFRGRRDITILRTATKASMSSSRRSAKMRAWRFTTAAVR